MATAQTTATSPAPYIHRLGQFLALAALFAGAILASPPSARAAAAEITPDRSRLSIERIFVRHEFDGREWGPARWLEGSAGGGGYTTLEPSAVTRGGRDVVRYDTESGRRAVLVTAAQLTPQATTSSLRIEDYAWSADMTKLLVFTNSKRVWRRNTRGDYWVLDMASGKLQQLGGKAGPSTLMFAAFSPDGTRAAYVCKNNLYVQDLKTFKIRQLTRDGSATIINGTSDWVNEEELDLRSAFQWSPDGTSIAYWQFDTSGVREYQLVNNTGATYPEITSFQYPKAGETNSACRVGIVKAAGGRTQWLATNHDPRNHYIPELKWSPDSASVILQQLNRLQNENEVIQGNVKKGTLRTLFTERDAAWVDVAHEDGIDQWPWDAAGGRLLWLSERDGWRHLYAVGAEGQLTLLTPGKYDVVSIAGLDAKNHGVYIIASPDNPTQRYLYEVPLDGSGRLTRLTPESQRGTHTYTISPDGAWAFHTWSRFGQPPATDLVALPAHKAVRTLSDSTALRGRLAQLQACPSEFFRVDIGGGVLLDGWCIRPPDFNPAKKYPVLFQVYGEPASQTVMDRWGGATYLWHMMLAQQGYLVMSIDNRGTPAPRGREWRKCVYRQIGVLAAADQAAAVRKIIAERPYADPARIGIWGWSGGGSMTLNALFRYPDLYRTGMAVAFVSDERLYDTIYQERYMGLPRDNAQDYQNGSPITFAKQLKGNLLLVHGTGDDNVHYQNCELLVNELIKQDKPFTMMVYPNRTHAIREGENTTRHLYETLTRYLTQNLPPGGR